MKYYFIGVKGSGMSTLACLLHDLGNTIFGYDDCPDYKFTMEGLVNRNIPIYTGNDLPKLDKDTIVTYTAAINTSHHEVKRMKDLGYKIVSYHKLIGSLTKKMESICVCGTHGKTTTSLMISSMLNKEMGCSYFVGDGSGHGNKDNNLFVIESCEFNKHFLSYYPTNVVLTNVELDHTETYPTIYHMILAFTKFVNKAKNFVIACGDDLNIQKIKCFKKTYYYGFNKDNDLICKHKKVVNNKTCFDVYYKNKLFDHYEIGLFGNHMILDSLACIMTGIMYSVSKETIKNTLENYVPAKRRFNETIIGNNIIVDDYAHHPTEIKVTYDSAHQKYQDKKIIAVFLPNTYSRTEALFKDFKLALTLYDKCYLMDISCDREDPKDYPNISSEKLMKHIPNAEMIDLETCDKLLKHDNSVICFMSCANISKMIDKYKELKK